MWGGEGGSGARCAGAWPAMLLRLLPPCAAHSAEMRRCCSSPGRRRSRRRPRLATPRPVCWCAVPPAPQVAWGRHETVGEYMGAALVWLESGGQVGVGEVAARSRMPHPAALQIDTAALGRRR